MKRFRLYTEDVNAPDIIREVAQYFSSFTVYNACGVYITAKEEALIIEIITDYKDADIRVLNICKWICCEFDQHEVLVTSEDVHVCRVGQSGILNADG